MQKLTVKQALFVKHYLADLNATQAAIRAGYSKKTANVIGPENLAKPCIAEAVKKAMDKRAEKIGLSAETVLRDIKTIKEGCMLPGDAYNPNAALKACELEGKHLKMFTDKHEVTGKDGGPIETEYIIEFVTKEKE